MTMTLDRELEQEQDSVQDRQLDAAAARTDLSPEIRSMLAECALSEIELPTMIERQCHNLSEAPWGMTQERIAKVLGCRRETVCRALKRFTEKRDALIRWAAARRLGPDVVESLIQGRIAD